MNCRSQPPQNCEPPALRGNQSFEPLICQHAHFVILDKLAGLLVPPSRAIAEAVLPVTISAIFLTAAEFAFGVTTFAG